MSDLSGLFFVIDLRPAKIRVKGGVLLSDKLPAIALQNARLESPARRPLAGLGSIPAYLGETAFSLRLRLNLACHHSDQKFVMLRR